MGENKMIDKFAEFLMGQNVWFGIIIFAVMFAFVAYLYLRLLIYIMEKTLLKWLEGNAHEKEKTKNKKAAYRQNN